VEVARRARSESSRRVSRSIVRTASHEDSAATSIVRLSASAYNRKELDFRKAARRAGRGRGKRWRGCRPDRPENVASRYDGAGARRLQRGRADTKPPIPDAEGNLRRSHRQGAAVSTGSTISAAAPRRWLAKSLARIATSKARGSRPARLAASSVAVPLPENRGHAATLRPGLRASSARCPARGRFQAT